MPAIIIAQIRGPHVELTIPPCSLDAEAQLSYCYFLCKWLLSRVMPTAVGIVLLKRKGTGNRKESSKLWHETHPCPSYRTIAFQRSKSTLPCRNDVMAWRTPEKHPEKHPPSRPVTFVIVALRPTTAPVRGYCRERLQILVVLEFRAITSANPHLRHPAQWRVRRWSPQKPDLELT
jgi:hypothetical protein